MGVVRQIDGFLKMTAPQARSEATDAEAAYTKIYQNLIALHDKGYITASIFEDVKRIVSIPIGDSFLTFWQKQKESTSRLKADHEYVFISQKVMPIPKRAATVSAGEYIHGIDSVFSQRLTTVKNLLKLCLAAPEKSTGIVAITQPALWEDITITLNNDNTITVHQVDTHCGEYSLKELGFTDKGTRDLSALFQKIILQQAEKFGISEKLIPVPPDLKAKQRLEKSVSDIRKILQKAFSIPGRPISAWDKTHNAYIPVFTCKVHSQLSAKIWERRHSLSDENIGDKYSFGE